MCNARMPCIFDSVGLGGNIGLVLGPNPSGMMVMVYVIISY